MLSRVADNLYWMSRYLERAEHTARSLDVTLQSMMDFSPELAEQRLARLFRTLGTDAPCPPSAATAFDTASHLTVSPDCAVSIATSICVARENAREVRQQISSEMWEQVNSLYHRTRRLSMNEIWADRAHAFLKEIKQGCHLFQGITDSTLSHGEGWHFIQIGRFLERAGSISRLLADHFVESAPRPVTDATHDASDYLEWAGLLKTCTAFEAYCKVYTVGLHPERIAEFLLLDAGFPHSVAYCATAIRASLDAIGQLTDAPRNALVNRLAGRLCAALDFSNIAEILTGGLPRILGDIPLQCAEIHNALSQKYVTYPIEEALAS